MNQALAFLSVLALFASSALAQSSSEFNEGGNEGGNVIINGGSNGVIINNGQTVRVVDGSLLVTEGGQDYVFKPRTPSVKEKETVTINGQPATVSYENGGVKIERQDGNVIAYGEEGLFMGDRNSYANRAQIPDQINKEMEQLNRQLEESMANMQQEFKSAFKGWPFQQHDSE